MTYDRQQLAEDAASALGWLYHGDREAEDYVGWIDAEGRPCADPSIDDPAFCWELFIWSVCNEVAMPDWSVTVGSIPEALARAVVATKEESARD